MHFMLIVKNLFSFYVEFEILLYFLLFCRLFSVNKDSTWEIMLGTRWVRFTRKNQVKSIPIQKLRIVILELRTANALWFVLEKNAKLRTVIFGLTARIGNFKAVFSFELIDLDIPSSKTSLNWLERRSKARKERENTIGERFEGELKNRVRNRRSSFLYSFLMLYCCLNMNLDTIFDMICG
jgi:hypothetical protein